MKIAILGSTGFVGKLLIHKADAASYRIITQVRNPEKLKDFILQQISSKEWIRKAPLISSGNGTE